MAVLPEQSGGQNSAYRSGCFQVQIRSPEKTMSAPSRRPEIRRRRTRNEKIAKLRKRYTAAASETDRSRLAAKLSKLARTSPGQPLLKA
jgi:hypothetical protein